MARNPRTPDDNSLTFITGARGSYRIDCENSSEVTVNDNQGDLGSEEALRHSNTNILFVACLAALIMAAGFVILIRRMRQRKKMSQAEDQVQATD